ncbi:hypothetical protein NESM_000810800 [Novymonas esmeraldas]|uniref:Surface antigen-like protein n=1 Tax=Novymonas esmeraldas TaxID=1808958 RepID=A0AAW0EYY0_9TRYP
MASFNSKALMLAALTLVLAVLTVCATAQGSNCQVPGCTSCHPSSSLVCLQCQSGYFLDQSTCHPNGTCGVTNCQVCVSGSVSKCSVCNSGYSLTSSFLCGPKHRNAATAAPGALIAVSGIVVAAACVVVAL